MRQNKNYDYHDPFRSPRANAKHASYQVNGETQQTQRNIITAIQAKKMNR